MFPKMPIMTNRMLKSVSLPVSNGLMKEPPGGRASSVVSYSAGVKLKSSTSRMIVKIA